MISLADLLADLNEESQSVDRLVADLPEAGWERDTPAPGWTIAHQIAHLHWTDRMALLSATEPAAFGSTAARAAAGELPDLVERGVRECLAAPAELLARWREGRAALAAALVGQPPGARLPWFAAPMSPAMMATARLMETWAHGEDVAAALSLTRAPTVRLRHVAFLGVRTIGYGFLAHGYPAPTEPVYVELQAPDASTWAYGPPDAANRITGPALDFCLLATQRAHPADLALEASGPVATRWLQVAQAFAGPPGAGRAPSHAPHPSPSTGQP